MINFVVMREPRTLRRVVMLLNSIRNGLTRTNSERYDSTFLPI